MKTFLICTIPYTKYCINFFQQSAMQETSAGEKFTIIWGSRIIASFVLCGVGLKQGAFCEDESLILVNSSMVLNYG